ncbi:TetR/AcrR family transcriptional regulator [Novosphingobium bradum]|uniref:TetR/AcrR family transcriptional regulator n=1 Tax=Novosphingobium bradum TaxID=1737444 RepID=A0ABV7ITF4_9SPHN
MNAPAEVASLKRRRGRPRDAALEARLLTSCLEVLAEGGFSGLTVERICERAEITKKTFYLRWPSAVDAAYAAFGRYISVVEFTDTGDAVADVLRLARQLIEWFQQPVMGQCYRFILAETQVRPAYAAHLLADVTLRRDRDRAELAAAMKRQGLPGADRADLVLNAVNGVAFNASLVWGTSEADLDYLVRALILGEPFERANETLDSRG